MGTSVEAVLRAFNGPINEPQAWALCFQTVKHLSHPFPSSLTTKDLILDRDGSVRLRSTATGESRPHSVPADRCSTDGHASEKEFLFSLGRLLYAALDFGLRETEERVLEPELESFIEKLVTKEDEGSCDEGIENDEEDSAHPTQQPLTRESVLQVSC